VSNWLQAGKMYQNNAAKFSAFAKENDKRTIFLKNETTKTLLKTVKTSILGSEKTQPLGQNLFAPAVHERNFMMEDTL
jgi:ABC-type Zn uptake system ZnuABC Zn-binding protein ZnuA